MNQLEQTRLDLESARQTIAALGVILTEAIFALAAQAEAHASRSKATRTATKATTPRKPAKGS